MVIEQILHGYDRGHTEIASSISLSSAKDLLMMDNLSDWSGYNSSDGYLTIYKLKECPYFVIAKTWYASEMERSGSVWTHSLLIRTNAIPRNFDFRFLLNLFARPEVGKYSQYQSSIHIEDFTIGENELLSEETIPQTLLLYYLLLEGHQNIIFSIDLPQQILQIVIVTILQYLPLNIVWKISGCTGTLTPRKYDSESLSIQFTESSNNKLFSGKVNKTFFAPGILEILEYVGKCMRNANDDFFSAFRIFTNDIGTSSDKASTMIYSLMKLTQVLRKTHGKSEDYLSILNHISSNFPNKQDGQKLKENFLNERIFSLFYNNKINWLNDILCHTVTDAFDIQLIYEEILSAYDNDKESVWNLISNIIANSYLSSTNKQIIHQFVYSRTDEELTEWVIHWPESFITFASYDPNLLSNKIWLSVSSSKNFKELLWIFMGHISIKFSTWKDLIERILKEHCSVTGNFAKFLIQKENSSISTILDFQNSSETLNMDHYLLCEAVSQTPTLVKWVKNHSTINDVISTYIISDIKYNEYKIKLTDSTFWRNIMLGKTMSSTSYYSYFYIIAHMIDQGENTLDIIKPTFYYLHIKLSRNEDVKSIMSAIEPYLAKVKPWKDWDNCLKLRKGLIKWLKKCGYPYKILKDFTPDSHINKNLANLWGKK